MRKENMEGSTKDDLMVIGWLVGRGKRNSSRQRSKSKGRSKSLRQSTRKCWKCGKVGNLKKDCKSKIADKRQGSKKNQSTKGITYLEYGGDMYLVLISTQSNWHARFVNLGTSCHMIAHGEWLCESKRYDGGDVLLGDDSPTNFVKWGKFWLLLRDWRRTLHITRMSDVGVRIMFEKDSCKMVHGVMVLMRGDWIGTLYILLGRTNTTVILEVIKISSCLFNLTTLWYWWLEHIREKSIFCMHSKGMLYDIPNFSLSFNFCEHYAFGRHS